jgi:hypothetical protein
MRWGYLIKRMVSPLSKRCHGAVGVGLNQRRNWALCSMEDTMGGQLWSMWQILLFHAHLELLALLFFSVSSTVLSSYTFDTINSTFISSFETRLLW